MCRLALAKAPAAFLDLIAWSEGTSNSPVTQDDGYDIIVTGMDGPHTFSDYSAHPFAAGRKPIVLRTAPTLLESTASGRYQIILPTWKGLLSTPGPTVFSPQAQDLAALHLINQNGALTFVDDGKIADAIYASAATWASFPGNDYGQGGHTLTELLAQYATLLAAQPQ